MNDEFSKGADGQWTEYLIIISFNVFTYMSISR